MSEFYSVSMSGGKDSTALALWVREQGLPHLRIFADTGWEAQETYDYLDYLEGIVGPIVRVRAEKQMVERVMKHNTWPGRTIRWCTEELKILPIKEYLDGFRLADCYTDLVEVVGIRADESTSRAKMTEREWSDRNDRWIWRPCLSWSLSDVFAIHHRNAVKVNPLYEKGF